MDGDNDIFTVPCERFVDSVIHNLKYHVVQTGAVIRIADIHARALTYRIQPFQDFDTGGVIRIRHQRFSLICLGLIRYFTLFHGEHLRIFVRHVHDVVSAYCTDKNLRLRAFKRLASSRALIIQF
jgi:hypothetical protein